MVDKNITRKNRFILDLMEKYNMKKTIRAIILIASVIWYLPCYSQLLVYPFLYRIQVNTEVSYDSLNKMFFYAYKLFNDPNNNGNLQEFEIDISRGANTISLDTVGLRFTGSGFMERMFRQDFPSRSQSVVPVGFPTIPNIHWTATLNNRPTALIFTNSFFVKPGNGIEGIVIMCKGLPCIRSCVVKPNFQDDLLFPNPDDTTVTYYVPPEDSIREVVNYHGLTVGPSAPPINFIATVWCDTLISYTTQSRALGWIKDDATANKYLGYFASAKTKLVQHDSVGARNVLLQVLHEVNIDSTASLSSESYALLRFNTEYIVNILPQAQTAPIFAVKLVSSAGTKLTTGTLQYYDSAWKDATNNNDGTFFVNTSAKTLSLRMTYEFGTQTKSNVPISNDTIVFQTVNAQIQLQNSNGTLIDTGTVQYYSGAWRNIGTTANGVATKELLPNSYSFRMTYGYASNDKQQDISINPNVIFKTINAAVQLKNSQGTLMDQGTVQYYSGAWRDLGSTTNGVANKELLPNNYSFRMSYAYASKDKQQDIGTNATVVFQTVNAAVQLQNSQGTLMDQGTVQYYSGAWRDLGITVNGVVSKDLLPNTYSFRMNYASASKDKQQDITTNPTVVFQTVNATVQLKNSLGTLIDTGVVQYYSGAWLTLGTTTNGVAAKELLPNSYSFRMNYAYSTKDKQQDINTNPTVVFQTVSAAVQLKNSSGVLIDTGTVQYYSGAWRSLGTTTNGVTTKELLPNSYSFRMTYALVSLDKTQDISNNATVNFSTVLCTVRVKNSQSQFIDNALASYYSGVWKQIGNTINGIITKELLPVSLSFRVKYGTQQIDKQQNLSTNNLVDFVVQ